jgi:hypothetical protein
VGQARDGREYRKENKRGDYHLEKTDKNGFAEKVQGGENIVSNGRFANIA